MKIPALAVAVAPLSLGSATGGQENDPTATSDPKRITPITKRGEPNVDMRLGMTPESFWRTAAAGAPDPANHTAPPSVMQIRISQLLDAQASRLEEKTEEAIRAALAKIEAETKSKADAHNPQPGPRADEADQDDAPKAEDAKPLPFDKNFMAYTEAKKIARSTVLSTFP